MPPVSSEDLRKLVEQFVKAFQALTKDEYDIMVAWRVPTESAIYTAGYGCGGCMVEWLQEGYEQGQYEHNTPNHDTHYPNKPRVH